VSFMLACWVLQQMHPISSQHWEAFNEQASRASGGLGAYKSAAVVAAAVFRALCVLQLDTAACSCWHWLSLRVLLTAAGV